jgi:hypothetical protein
MKSQENARLHPVEYEALAVRVEALERRAWRSRRAALALLVVTVALILFGAARPPRTVDAEQFILRNPSGMVLATLSPTNQGCELLLRNKSGKLQARLRSKWIGADLTLFDDQTQRELVRLDVAKGQATLNLTDEKSPQRALTLLMTAEKSGLIVTDASGKERLRAVDKRTGSEIVAHGQSLAHSK